MRAVHLSSQFQGRRSVTSGRAYPLAELDQPSKIPISGIVKWLDVERSPRYQPEPDHTFCNIYAYDVCYIAGVYLPRVWWMNPATVTEETQVVYGKTVGELNANALYDWLHKWGAEFGWEPVDDAAAAQQAADAGRIVVICAAQANPTRSGHITVVVPQGDKIAEVVGGAYRPVQSQAGRKNFECSCDPGRWWEGKSYRGFGIWSNKSIT